MFLDRKKFLISLILLCLIGSVSAYDGSILKDYYFDTDQNEVIYLYPVLENHSAYFFDDMSYLMINDSVKYSITLSSNDSGDVPFNIVLFDGELENYTNGDYAIDDYLVINNNSLIYFVDDFDSNKTLGEIGSYNVCGYLRKSPASADSSIRFFSGYNSSGVYTIDYSHSLSVTSTSYLTYCGDFSRAYNRNITVGDTEIFGVICDSCGADSVRLGLDDSSLLNNSRYSIDNNISNEINITDNLMLFATEFEPKNDTEVLFFDGVMRWRDPIYVNFSLFNEFKDDTGSIVRETYGNDNMILYAVPDTPYSIYVMDDVFSSTLNSFYDYGVNFDALFFGDYKDSFVFTHDRLSSGGVAEMKFYQEDNYTLYLRNIKLLDENKNIGEFDKPLYDSSDVDYVLTHLVINQSADYNIYFSEAEIRIYELYRNSFFYLVGFFIWLFVVIMLINLGLDLKVFIGSAVSMLIIIMGVISAIL